MLGPDFGRRFPVTGVPRVPPGLGKSGSEFWRSTQKAYHPDARDWPILLETCRVLDEIDALTAVVAAQGVMSTGSQGQVVEHPALSGLRAHRLTLDRLLVRLALPDEEDEDDVPDSLMRIRAKKAAAARWKGHRRDTGRRAVRGA
jgi:hypothetical protein